MTKKNSKNKNEYTLYINEGEQKKLNYVFLKTLNLNFKIDLKNLYSLVLFTNNSFEEKNSISQNHILGFQIYYKERDNLITKVFSNNDSTIYEIENLTSNVEYLSTTDIFKCSQVFNSPQKSTFIFINTSFSFKPKKGKTNFKTNLKNYKREYLSKQSKSESIDDNNLRAIDGCSWPCTRADGIDCGRVIDNPRPDYYVCHQPLCFFRELQSQENNNNVIKEELNDIRYFRDNFLSNYSNGKKYISYYYELSDYSELFSETDWNQVKSVKPLLIDKMYSFMFENDTEILINDRDKNILVNFINSLKKVSKETHYQNIIKDLEIDLNLYSNNTIKDVKAMMNPKLK